MNPMFLAEIAAKSFLVAGASLALLALLKNRSAAERSWVAHAGLAVLMALPAVALILPRWRILAPREPASSSQVAAAAPAPAPFMEAPFLLEALYIGGLILLLLGTAIAVMRLFSLRRSASLVIDAGWLVALARAQDRMGVKSGAALLVSDTLTSPVSWGMLRPTIVLNPGAVAAARDAEAILAHELAHVVRMDWAKLLAARVATAVFWFNPLVWMLASQCHQLREEAADDAVLRSNVQSTDYASLLVEAARHECRGALIAAHGVAPGKHSLHRRVARVLDAAARRSPTKVSWACACLLAAMVLAAPLATMTLERAEAAQDPQAGATGLRAAPATSETVVVGSSSDAKPTAITIRAQAPQSARTSVKVSGDRTVQGAEASPEYSTRGFRAPPGYTPGAASVISIKSATGETSRVTIAGNGATTLTAISPPDGATTGGAEKVVLKVADGARKFARKSLGWESPSEKVAESSATVSGPGGTLTVAGGARTIERSSTASSPAGNVTVSTRTTTIQDTAPATTAPPAR